MARIALVIPCNEPSSQQLILTQDDCWKLNSASTPTFAAIIANLNSVRMSKGKRPLGFLNPWLYGKARSGLTDITSGGSRGCYNESLSGFPSPEVVGAGWNATIGWDPVTGKTDS